MKHTLIIAILICMIGSCCLAAEPQNQQRYIVLAWSARGMPFYSGDFQDIAIQPVRTTLWAQVIKVGEPPHIVTEGIIVEYSFRDNTYSAGKESRRDKTNFWKHVKRLFNAEPEINTGLSGKGLSGRMDQINDHFVADGIPLTEYRDADVSDTDRGTWERHPYQLASVVVKDEATGVELCRASVAAPVSSEMDCAVCHNDQGMATKRHSIAPTGKAETNILALHDKLNHDKYPVPLMQSRPVLCAGCHASNIIGALGQTGILNLSNAIHKRHQEITELTNGTAGCYYCHPGKRTQFLRGTMSVNYKLNCTTCHGELSKVARNPEPWKVEPRCDNISCHGQGYALDKQLYHQSKAKTGVYCSGCHDSAHAIAPSRQESDQIKFKDLQGSGSTLRSCAACHGQEVEKPFKH